MVFQNNVLSGAAGSGTTAYEIDQSIRFNPADSAYMSRTPSGSSSSRKKWTFSGWFKRGNITPSSSSRFFNVHSDSNNFFISQFQSDDNQVKQEYEKFSSLVVIEYFLKQLTFKDNKPSYIKTQDKNLYEWLEELKIQLIECDEEV